MGKIESKAAAWVEKRTPLENVNRKRWGIGEVDQIAK